MDQLQRHRRHTRLRHRLTGTPARPRVSVYRSNTRVELQLIDDVAGRTLTAIHEQTTGTGTRVDRAKEAGVKLAEQAKALGITQVVFDRGGYKYHGRIKAVADGLRAGGLSV